MHIRLLTHTSTVNGTTHAPRDVVWYPETNYCCNYDVDVQLGGRPGGRGRNGTHCNNCACNDV